MKQVYKSGAQAAVPSAANALSEGNPTEGNVAADPPVPATVIGDYAFYQLFKELEALIEDGVDGNGDAMVPDKTVLTQVRDALRSKYLAKADAVSGGLTGPVATKNADYTVTAADDGKTTDVDASAGARDVDLPDLGVGDNGFTHTVVKTDNSANEVTVDDNGNDQINGAATYVLKEQWEGVTLKWTGAEWLAIGGATGALLRDFSARAAAVDITAVGQRIVTWDLMATKAVAILAGGGGGGGGVHGGIYWGAVGTKGQNTTLLFGGTTYTAEGGGYGGASRPNRVGIRGGAGAGRDAPPWPETGNDGAWRSGGPGASGDGGAGGRAGKRDNSSGGAGGGGELLVVRLSGLARGDTLTFSVGAGGAPGGVPPGWSSPEEFYTTTPTAGAAGHALLIPDLSA